MSPSYRIRFILYSVMHVLVHVPHTFRPETLAYFYITDDIPFRMCIDHQCTTDTDWKRKQSGMSLPATYRFQSKNHWNREFENSKNNLVLIKLSTLEEHASQHLRPTLQRGTLFFFIVCLFFKVRLSGKHRNRNTGHGGLTCHESIL